MASEKLQASSGPKRLTAKQWEEIVPEVKDISDELEDSFLMVGQFMRAKIIWQGKKYYASGWNFGKEPFVDLLEMAD